jgi:hypothetical protein
VRRRASLEPELGPAAFALDSGVVDERFVRGQVPAMTYRGEVVEVSYALSGKRKGAVSSLVGMKNVGCL